jgi:dipeptidyl aminopeptidase/acylaminoacyl peptidase
MAIDAALPAAGNVIAGYDRSREKFIGFSSCPKGPGPYYMALRSSGHLAKIRRRNAIPIGPDKLGERSAITFAARDGMQISAYLTLPPGAKKDPLPFVITHRSSQKRVICKSLTLVRLTARKLGQPCNSGKIVNRAFIIFVSLHTTLQSFRPLLAGLVTLHSKTSIQGGAGAILGVEHMKCLLPVRSGELEKSKSVWRAAAAAFMACVFAATVAPLAANAVSPVEAFASLPQFQSVRLSPDGKRIAALEPVAGQRRLVLYRVGDTMLTDRRVFQPRAKDELPGRIYDVIWANNNRLIMRFKAPVVRNRRAFTETRMIAIDVDFGNLKLIPKLRSNRPKTKVSLDQEETYLPPQYQDSIIHRLSKEPNHILIQLRRYGQKLENTENVSFVARKNPVHSVYKVNVRTGGLSRVDFGAWYIRGYIVDQQGNVRLRTILRNDDGSVEIRKAGRRAWDIHQAFSRAKGAHWTPIAFAADPNILYIGFASKQGRSVIHEYHVATKTIGRRILENDRVDVDGLVLDHEDAVVGADFTLHAPRVAYLKEPYISLQKKLDLRFPDTRNYIRSTNKARDRFVVFSTAPTRPGTFGLMLEGSNEKWIEVGRQYPGLSLEDLRPMTPITYRARDGLEIPGYITKPAGPGPWPMVVMPHGGPNVRDTQSFQFEVQFMASRGYAVFQPNFRGSSGYGFGFERAGHGEWGLAMQDDIADGARAMIDQNIAIANRICIVGWSYGGYAALMGVIRTPNLYRCAVAGAAITDLDKLLRERGQYLFESNNDPRIGSRWRDQNKMRDTSPVNNTDAISVPVLLVHGEKDRIVPIEHSELMAKQLRRDGVSHKFLRLSGGDHARSNPENRLRYLKALEAFLSANLMQ